MSGIDPQLVLFRRQYLQVLDPDFLSWPPKTLLQDAEVQQWIYRNFFEHKDGTYLPHDRYRFRVLKSLIAKIELAIDDPEEQIDLYDQEVSEDILSHFSSLVSGNVPSESSAVQQRSFVTYTCSDRERTSEEAPVHAVTILEKRNLISGSQTTGFRTWEAALHLTTFLCTDRGREMVAGKKIVELGSGTGLLSLLCTKYLYATRVTATDGDEAVLGALRDNALLNGVGHEERLVTSVLRWGHGIRDIMPEDDLGGQAFDVMLGADIIYDRTAVSPLIATMSMLFAACPDLKVLMGTAVRNENTFNTFLHACSRHAYALEEIEFAARPMREQPGPFYATVMPLKIYVITSAGGSYT